MTFQQLLNSDDLYTMCCELLNYTYTPPEHKYWFNSEQYQQLSERYDQLIIQRRIEHNSTPDPTPTPKKRKKSYDSPNSYPEFLGIAEQDYPDYNYKQSNF
jgi:hypothetical protein